MTEQPTQLASDVEYMHAARPAGPSQIWPARAAALAGASWFLLHSLFVISGPESRVMEWLYDDSFYYMITAKHFSERHISSFDGVTVTSGYHPLWMWICAVLYSLRGRLDLDYVRSCMTVSAAITGTLLLIAVWRSWTRRQAGLLWALGLAATSYSALNNGLSVMEWPLVVLCWFLLHPLLTRCAQPRFAQATALFMLGVAGSFSRTDFGLIPACYLAASLMLGVRLRVWSCARRATLATAGALAGLPLVFAYNRRMTGSWLQSSAEVKRLFASLTTPFNPFPALWQFLRVLLYLPALNLTPAMRAAILHDSLFFIPVPILLMLLAWIAWRKRQPKVEADAMPGDPMQKLAIVASALGVIAYLLLDAFNTQAAYGWYTAAVTGFILVLTASFLQTVRMPVAAAIVFPIMIANMVSAEVRGGNALTQVDEVYVGRALHEEHPGARMGGGDVGKPSFYNDGAMFNLDGLMNNEVVPYLAAGRIHCYLLHRRIEYISDIGSVTLPITDAERARHGEAHMPWDTYILPVKAKPLPGEDGPLQQVTYFKVNLDAIQASGDCAP